MHYKKFNAINDDIVSIMESFFVKEQGFQNEFDDTDKVCTHIVFYDQAEPFNTLLKRLTSPASIKPSL